LTPKEHSTGVEQRMGGIHRAGNERLRRLLVAGATSVTQAASKPSSRQMTECPPREAQKAFPAPGAQRSTKTAERARRRSRSTSQLRWRGTVPACCWWTRSAGRREPDFPVIGLPKPVLHRELPTLAASYDHVPIDGPPQVADITRSATWRATWR